MANPDDATSFRRAPTNASPGEADHFTGARSDPQFAVIGGRASETAIIGATTIAALYLGQSLLIPLALAIFLSFLLSPVVTALRKLRLPKGAAVMIVALVAFLAMITFGFFFGRQVTGFAENLPRYKIVLSEKIRTLKEFTSASSKLEEAAQALRSLRKEIETDAPKSTSPPQASTQSPDQPQKPITVTVEPTSTPLEQLHQTIAAVAPPLITTGIVGLFVIILLLYREDLRDRAIRLFGVQDLERTTRALDDAGRRLNRYFVATTAINVCFGTLMTIGLWWIGIPNPVLWGAVAFLMRYVPYIGVPLAAVFPVLLSVVVDPGWSMLAETLALFVLLELFISQVVETFVHGEATGLSPLAIILAATFWTLIWGPVGLVLAVPLTVMLAVLGRHVERFAVLEVLLGAAPALSPADRFYQRMLAGDPEEAADQAQRALKDMSLSTYYDTVAMEALRKAMRDAEAGRLAPDRFGQIEAALAVFTEAVTDSDEIAAKTVSTDQQTKTETTNSAATLPLPVDAPATVLCIPARNKLDAAAAALLVHMLEQTGVRARVMSVVDFAGMPAAERAQIRTVCVSAFDAAERGASIKFLLRRLRRMMPHAEFLGGFWRLETNNPAHEILIDQIGADSVVTTLTAAVDRCMRPASRTAPTAPAVPANGHQTAAARA